jgi:hypothetical protein
MNNRANYQDSILRTSYTGKNYIQFVCVHHRHMQKHVFSYNVGYLPYLRVTGRVNSNILLEMLIFVCVWIVGIAYESLGWNHTEQIRPDQTLWKRQEETSWLVVVSTMRKQKDRAVSQDLINSRLQDINWQRKCCDSMLFSTNEVKKDEIEAFRVILLWRIGQQRI